MPTQPEVNYVSRAELVKIVDGDTLRLDIDLGYTIRCRRDVRLLGVDTPEVRGPEREAGKYVKRKVEEFFQGYTELIVHSLNFSTGKYGRNLCEIWVSGNSLNRYLLDRRLGWPTDSNGLLRESRDLALLDIPESVYLL
jgi:micrococcal nuclease